MKKLLTLNQLKRIYRNDVRGVYIVSRMQKWLNGQKAPPYLINFYFTKRCNIKCRFCYYGGHVEDIDHTDELTQEELLRITKDGCDFGIDWWYLAGGEPLFNPNVTLDMMRIIKKSGKMGNINTNGLMMTERVAREIVDLGWDEINFSINSPDSFDDDYLRGMDNIFKISVKNIKILNNIKKEKRSKKPLLSIHTVITKRIYNKISRMVKLAKELNAISINFSHVMWQTDLVKNLRLNETELKFFKEDVKKADKLTKRFNMFSNLYQYVDSEYNDQVGKFQEVLNKRVMKKDKTDLLSSICFEPWLEVGVFADGTIGPCGSWDPNRLTENLRNKSFEDIWYGDKFQKIRDGFINNVPDPLCQDCASSRIYRNEEVKERLSRIIKL